LFFAQTFVRDEIFVGFESKNSPKNEISKVFIQAIVGDEICVEVFLEGSFEMKFYKFIEIDVYNCN